MRGADQTRHACHSGVAGFTLVEMIAVLVLVGMLAAIVVTRYADMQNAAMAAAANAALAAGKQRATQTAARFLLNTATPARDLSDLTSAAGGLENPYEAEDFSVEFSGAGPVITVKAVGKEGTRVVGATATGNVNLVGP